MRLQNLPKKLFTEEISPIPQELGLKGTPVTDFIELIEFLANHKSHETVTHLGNGAESLVFGIESLSGFHVPIAAKVFYDSFTCEPSVARSLVEMLCIDGNTADLMTTKNNHISWICSGDWHIKTLVDSPRKLFVKKQGDPRTNVLKSYWAQFLASYHPFVDSPYGIIVANNSPVGFFMPMYTGDFFSLSELKDYDTYVDEFKDLGITVDSSPKGYNGVILPNGDMRIFDLSLIDSYFPGNVFS